MRKNVGTRWIQRDGRESRGWLRFLSIFTKVCGEATVCRLCAKHRCISDRVIPSPPTAWNLESETDKRASSYSAESGQPQGSVILLTGMYVGAHRRDTQLSPQRRGGITTSKPKLEIHC